MGAATPEAEEATASKKDAGHRECPLPTCGVMTSKRTRDTGNTPCLHAVLWLLKERGTPGMNFHLHAVQKFLWMRHSAASLYLTDRVRTGRVLQEADYDKIMIKMVKMIKMLPDD